MKEKRISKNILIKVSEQEWLFELQLVISQQEGFLLLEAGGYFLFGTPGGRDHSFINHKWSTLELKLRW